MKEFAFYLLASVIGLMRGFNIFWMTPDEKQKIRAEGAVSVYEKRAVCEKALDQWVCSIPKE